MSYYYDRYHNVIKAVSAEGLVYEFTYDQWGNNTSVSISNGSNKVTSSAAYSADGNTLVSTTDALAKVTQYGYNGDTNVLQWAQYPEDTEAPGRNTAMTRCTGWQLSLRVEAEFFSPSHSN